MYKEDTLPPLPGFQICQLSVVAFYALCNQLGMSSRKATRLIFGLNSVLLLCIHHLILHKDKNKSQAYIEVNYLINHGQVNLF